MNKEMDAYLRRYGYSYKLCNDGSAIFFNIHNGNVFKITKSAFAKFYSGFLRNKKHDTKLIRDIKKLIKISHPKKRDVKKQPFHIQWHLNEECNLQCKHCYQTNYSCLNQLSFQEIKEIVDKCFLAIEQWRRLPEFSLTGGEPLLRKDLFRIVRYIRSKDMNTTISLLTNGTLIDKQMVKKIKKERISSVQLSLEGSTKRLNDSIRGGGVFDKVIEAAKLLKEGGIKISFHFVLSELNKADIFAFIRLAQKLKVNLLTISTLIPLGSAKNMGHLLVSPRSLKNIFTRINRIAKSLAMKKDCLKIRRTRTLWCNFMKKTSNGEVGGFCPVGKSTLTILSDGTVLPCRRLPIPLGNIKQQSLFEIWYGSDILWILRDRKKLDGCGECKFLNSCGGCRGLAYSYFGFPTAADPQCWLINKNIGDYYGPI